MTELDDMEEEILEELHKKTGLPRAYIEKLASDIAKSLIFLSKKSLSEVND